jgi:hypothetical protein
MKKKKIDSIIEAVRKRKLLKEEGVIANNVGDGKIAGTPQADPGNPPVDLRKHRKWNPFFKNLSRILRRNRKTK